jgi:hypothetical protein
MHDERSLRSALHALPFRSALCLLLLVAGCRTGGGWTPADAAAFERLPVESTGRWGSTTELRFGDYTADSVNVSWARGSGGGVQLGRIGTDRATSRQEYRFSLRLADGTRVPVSCESTIRERHVGVRSVEVRTSARYEYNCDIRSPHGAVWRMALLEEGSDGMAGLLTMAADARLTVRSQVGGQRVTGRRAAAYELRDDTVVVATVDPRARVVWLSHRHAAADRRTAAAAAAVALLLYQRPTR